MPKVSVIVPVYNIEKYLRECVDSILAQTFTDFELILVDDGSTDGSSSICDEYAKMDSRVEVIHKQNAGVSAARNTGIDAAKGEYIMFVDADDWVEVDIIAYLYEGITKQKADVSSCYGIHEYLGKSIIVRNIFDPIILSSKQAILDLLEGAHISASPWGKLYKKSVLKSISFKNMTYAEDFFFNYDVFSQSSKIYITSGTKYHYRQRKSSGARKSSIVTVNILDSAFQEILFNTTDKKLLCSTYLAMSLYYYFLATNSTKGTYRLIQQKMQKLYTSSIFCQFQDSRYKRQVRLLKLPYFIFSMLYKAKIFSDKLFFKKKYFG